MGALRRVHGPKEVADAWELWTRFVFGSMGKVEQQFQIALLGKHSTRFLMDAKGRANFKVGVEQAAKGLLDTNEQVAAARFVDRAYGKYSKFGPEERKWLTMYTPFAAWYLNSVRFFARVLPVDHPVLLSLMASANEATQEWRKAHGLIEPWASVGDKTLPGFLQGSIPLSGGRHQRFPARDTPFGAFTDFTATPAGLLLPQLSGFQKALEGTDWKNETLRNPDGSRYSESQKLHYAAVQGVLGMFPVVQKIQQIIQDPRKSLDPTYPVQPSSSSSSSSSGKKRRGGGPFIPSVPIPNVPIPGP
jgi:hypothetical protein